MTAIRQLKAITTKCLQNMYTLLFSMYTTCADIIQTASETINIFSKMLTVHNCVTVTEKHDPDKNTICI